MPPSRCLSATRSGARWTRHVSLIPKMKTAIRARGSPSRVPRLPQLAEVTVAFPERGDEWPARPEESVARSHPRDIPTKKKRRRGLDRSRGDRHHDTADRKNIDSVLGFVINSAITCRGLGKAPGMLARRVIEVPVSAGQFSSQSAAPPGSGIGRRNGLKIRRPLGRAGSSPASGITAREVLRQ